MKNTKRMSLPCDVLLTMKYVHAHAVHKQSCVTRYLRVLEFEAMKKAWILLRCVKS